MINQTVAESFGRQGLLACLGAQLVLVDDGTCVIELPFGDHLSQQHGVFHAGALATIADSAMGYAAMSRFEPGEDIVSVEFKVSLLEPAAGDMARAVGKVLRLGSRLSSCEARVTVTNSGGSDVVCATATGTMYRIRSRAAE